MVNEDDLVILVKWSKTLQATNQGSYILLPKLDVSAICPWQRFMAMNKKFPVHQNSPCFSGKNFMLVEPILRNHLRQIVADMGLDTSSYTFHTFRRSGATFAHNLDVPLDSIKRHGTWKSDAVQSYIIDDPQRASAVAKSFKNFFTEH